MNKNFFFLIFVFFFNFLSFSQDKKYAKEIIKKLSSEEFLGRGYSHNADKIASNFIKEELEKIPLQKFDTSFFQNFDISINNFSGKMTVEIDDKKLIPAVDYLIDGISKSCKGEFEIVLLNKLILQNQKLFDEFKKKKFLEKVILIDTVGVSNKETLQILETLIYFNTFKTAAYIEVYDKDLIFSPSMKEGNSTIIKVKRENISLHSKKIFIDVENQFLQKYETRNIAAFVQGKTDKFLVFSAHYDHIGEMGENVYFPGANDNASGVAMILDLAKYFANLKEKPNYSIAFLFFSAEEIGLIGSKYFCENPLFEMRNIECLINLDMVGSGEKGITIVNGKVFDEEFNKFTEINGNKNYLKKIKARDKAANSDHYFFYKNNVKSFFIYTLGNYKEYHNIYDKSEELPLNEYENLFKLLIDYSNWELKK